MKINWKVENPGNTDSEMKRMIFFSSADDPVLIVLENEGPEPVIAIADACEVQQISASEQILLEVNKIELKATGGTVEKPNLSKGTLTFKRK